ncbi:MAG: DUF58 domain-containing protein [Candidatus Thorarchaeota archaeon]|nr:DUF58 domain-containing protein [Candidatus Thorarchaeota archaeon]NIW13405.1 DUF58 domain-containing protein [Candidatus Thorarchaeota archaeon]NIW51530.1 DUF58 domain-containing protein [Candidatus Korarchaeota archaeon]
MLTKRGGLFLILGIFLPLLGLSFLGFKHLLHFFESIMGIDGGAGGPGGIALIPILLPGINYLYLLTPYLIFIGFLLLIGFILSFMKFKISTDLKNIIIEREVNREKLFAGDFLRVTLKIRNSGRLMVDHLYLADLLPDVFELTMGENFLATSLPPNTKAEFSYVITSPVRGEYELGPVYLGFQDRAGLFVQEEEINSRQKIVVYPRYESVRRMEYIRKAKGGLLMGEHRVIEKGQGYDFSRLRQYLPSDDIRLVDWKASARMNDLIVREYRKEKNIRMYILLDISRSMGYGKRDLTKLDYMVRAATFLAYMANRSGDDFGLLTYSDKPYTFIPAKRGKSHFFQMINAVSRVEHRGSSNLLTAMRELVLQESRVVVPFVFSDLEGDPSYIEEGMKIAAANRYKPMVIAPIGPYFERRGVEDEETKAFSNLALAEYVDRRERIKRALYKYRVEIIDVGPEEIIAGALEAYFASKARSGGISG